jgi:predicted lipid-binding transport protein (Tim44 family)
MIGGLIAGGLIGSLLFGGGSGGFGVTELAVLGVLAFMLIRKMRSPEAEPAFAGSQSRAVATRLDTRDAAPWGESSGAETRRPEPAVDAAEVTRNVTDVFLKVQAAWTARDLDPAAAILTPEMRAQLQTDCDRMKAQGRVNRIENVTVHKVEVTETWLDPGYNFMTVRIEATGTVIGAAIISKITLAVNMRVPNMKIVNMKAAMINNQLENQEIYYGK